MDVQQAIAGLNASLRRMRPVVFDSSWIREHRPDIYRLISTRVRTDLGDVDWDAIICRLEKPLQKKWKPKHPRAVTPYRNAREVRMLLRRHTDKLYVFLAALDQDDARLRDTITIPLVRLAQRGNVTARQKVLALLGDLVAQWIDEDRALRRWQGNPQEIRHHLRGCIRRYRFTGSFVGYVYMTLFYAGLGLPPPPLSLDEPILDGDGTRYDRVGQDPETGEVIAFRRRFSASGTIDPRLVL